LDKKEGIIRIETVKMETTQVARRAMKRENTGIIRDIKVVEGSVGAETTGITAQTTFSMVAIT
jgi:hypothetical protein